MAARLKYMAGREFVRQVSSGERDFSRMRLEEGFDLSGYDCFDGMQECLIYLQNHEANPLLITGSQLRGVKARGIYLPFVKGKGASFRRAELGEVNFEGADLERADFEGADLEGAYFLRAHLEKAHFGGADLRWAYLEGAHLQGAHLEKAHLQGAHLEKAHLQGAHLQGAHLKRAHLKRADLERADLKGALHLKDALGLGTTHFLRTRVSKEQRAIIGKALKKTPRLIVE